MATTRLYRGADGVYRPTTPLQFTRLDQEGKSLGAPSTIRITPLDQDRNPVAAPSLVAASNVAIDWSPAD